MRGRVPLARDTRPATCTGGSSTSATLSGQRCRGKPTVASRGAPEGGRPRTSLQFARLRLATTFSPRAPTPRLPTRCSPGAPRLLSGPIPPTLAAPVGWTLPPWPHQGRSPSLVAAPATPGLGRHIAERATATRSTASQPRGRVGGCVCREGASLHISASAAGPGDHRVGPSAGHSLQALWSPAPECMSGEPLR